MVYFYSGSSINPVYTYSGGTLPSGERVHAFKTPPGIISDSVKFEFAAQSTSNNYVLVDNMTIYIKQKARLVDYNFLYEGKQRQLFKGTQQVSQDFNIDSDDTVDGGPVITVTEVNPNVLQQISTTQLGNTNFQVE
jgi:hypothetical protein